MKNYQINSKLGEGGMATVYLAHDNKFDTNVAVKILNKEFVANDNIRKRFIVEAKSMFRMTHPNIIKVTDLIDDKDTVAFVMEFVKGETLKEFIERKGKLSDEEIKSLFSQMLDAVDYVHQQNLIHRDIKPSNFMVDSNGMVKLMDFGIAKTTDATAAEYTQTGTGMQMGTPMYMSPEQITETKSVTAQSDIYSLGVVLWQMVTGQKPYEMNTLSSFQLQTKIVNENLPQIQSSFSTIIEKATQKEIEKRFSTCSSFKDEIFNSTSNTEKTVVEVSDDKTTLENSRSVNEKASNTEKTNNFDSNKIGEEKTIIESPIKRETELEKTIIESSPKKEPVLEEAIIEKESSVLSKNNYQRLKSKFGVKQSLILSLIILILGSGIYVLFGIGPVDSYDNYFNKIFNIKSTNEDKDVFDLINSSIEAGDFAGAQAGLIEAIQKEPKNKKLHFTLGTIYMELKENEKAEASLNQALLLDPNYEDALYQLGAHLANWAIDIEHSRSELNYGDPIADRMYSEAHRLYSKATIPLEAYLAKNPNNKEVFNLLQKIYRFLGI